MLNDALAFVEVTGTAVMNRTISMQGLALSTFQVVLVPTIVGES